MMRTDYTMNGTAKMTDLEKTEHSRVKRLHERGAYDRATVYAILDATPLCHVAYVVDGQPIVTPTLQWREGDRIYWHGSSASRMLRRAEGQPVCLTVTHMDGLVLARSAFHHSANYRSVMLFGAPEKVTGAEKEARLETFVEGLYPGRWQTLRPMTAQEDKATTVLTMPIAEGSAKVRAGPPVDDEDDYALPIWSGVIPVRMAAGPAQADPRNLDGVTAPAHVRDFKLGS